MTLASSGTLSIGGSTSTRSINLEIGRAATATTGLNDSPVRTLAGKASGTIGIGDCYGKTFNTTGQTSYTTSGTFSFIVPAGVTSICALCVGGGGKGGVGTAASSGQGGGLSYSNAISVTPGETLTVVVGVGNVTSGTTGDSRLHRAGTNLVMAKGGAALVANATNGVGSSRQNGGSRATNFFESKTGQWTSGGGGAAGYVGAGGNGGGGAAGGSQIGLSAGSGGGGGGGGGGNVYQRGGGGGGVGIFGQGTNGAAGTPGGTYDSKGGGGGSGGTGGTQGLNGSGGAGGLYGGGGGASTTTSSADGGVGAVRIIWGANRSYPSTNTGDIF